MAFALLDRPTVARLSRIGSSLFLPLLIISSTGPQLTISSVSKLWILLVWALVSSGVTHGLGWVGQRVLPLEHWTILAAGRANSNALLLLLLSLKTKGVLDVFEMGLGNIDECEDEANALSVVMQIIPPFHAAFFSPGGVFTNIITRAADNLSELFGALQIFALGTTLALTPSSLKAKPTVWVLLVRYVFMPAISMGAVWSTAGRGWYDSDGLMWWVPPHPHPLGPSALLLLSVAQQDRVDEGPVAGFLIVAYLCAPLMAFVCSLGMSVVQGLKAR
ncbi:hypothetical protein FIBSPDRAFT_978694 [Athelia psychrophila]|uniref:Auxin efflux carrier n=1 Tax=Athelia psychrophila TaxID=1759441 RepID=A0A166TJC5_9AGAM|nr:hypothetical protein FIBSPDRAFT_978694 [Fibularhizoctonia sp. CBS 109695]